LTFTTLSVSVVGMQHAVERIVVLIEILLAFARPDGRKAATRPDTDKVSAACFGCPTSRSADGSALPNRAGPIAVVIDAVAASEMSAANCRGDTDSRAGATQVGQHRSWPGPEMPTRSLRSVSGEFKESPARDGSHGGPGRKNAALPAATATRSAGHSVVTAGIACVASITGGRCRPTTIGEQHGVDTSGSVRRYRRLAVRRNWRRHPSNPAD
jgi:hypothetical protein